MLAVPLEAERLQKYLHLLLRFGYDQIAFNEDLFVLLQIIEDFQQKAISVGSEDPQSASILQKCEEYLPGEVKNVVLFLSKQNSSLLCVFSGETKEQSDNIKTQAIWQNLAKSG